MNVIDPIAQLLGSWSYQINFYSIVLKFLVSFVLAAIIGCERATKMHDAGLRTFIITALVATGAGITDVMLSSSMQITSYVGAEQKVLPILSCATIIGAAILSSNTVLFSAKNKLKGLTTAITLWGIVAVGVAIGVGFYTIGVIGFLLIALLLSFTEPFEKFLKNRSSHFEIHLELKDRASLKNFITTIRKLGLKIQNIEINSAYANSGLAVYSVALKIVSKELKKYKTNKEIVEAIGTLEYVHFIEEIT